MSKISIVLAVIASTLIGFAWTIRSADAFFSGGAYGPYTGTVYMLGAQNAEPNSVEKHASVDPKGDDCRVVGAIILLTIASGLLYLFCDYLKFRAAEDRSTAVSKKVEGGSAE